jgi:serine/threonine protein phosphatase 1
MPIDPPPHSAPRRLIIGDVHGHYEALLKLFEVMAPTTQDAVYFMGDLIDRGPESARVVDFVMQNKYHCILGNHEQMMLEALQGGALSSQLLQAWLYSGGQATLESYNYQIPQQHVSWMQNLPLYLDLGNIWLVHAGLDPQLPLEDQGQEQFCWIRDKFHQSRYPYFADKLIIIGHTITFTFPQVEPGKLVSGVGWLGIDTGAYHPRSGWLTAVEVNHNWVYQIHRHSGAVRCLPLEEIVVFLDPLFLAGRQRRPQRLRR